MRLCGGELRHIVTAELAAAVLLERPLASAIVSPALVQWNPKRVSRCENASPVSEV